MSHWDFSVAPARTAEHSCWEIAAGRAIAFIAYSFHNRTKQIKRRKETRRVLATFYLISLYRVPWALNTPLIVGVLLLSSLLPAIYKGPLCALCEGLSANAGGGVRQAKREQSKQGVLVCTRNMIRRAICTVFFMSYAVLWYKTGLTRTQEWHKGGKSELTWSQSWSLHTTLTPADCRLAVRSKVLEALCGHSHPHLTTYGSAVNSKFWLTTLQCVWLCVFVSMCVYGFVEGGGGQAVCVWVMHGTFELTKWHFTIPYKVHGNSPFYTTYKDISLYIVLLKL